MSKHQLPLFRKTFAVKFIIIIVITGLLSIALTSTSLYLFYANTLTENTKQTSNKLNSELERLKNNLIEWVGELAEIIPKENLPTEFSVRRGYSELIILGIGTKTWWEDSYGMSSHKTSELWSDETAITLGSVNDGGIELLVAGTINTGQFIGQRLISSFILNEKWVEETSALLGGHLAICSDDTSIILSSFQITNELSVPLSSLDKSSLVEIGGELYGFRLLPLSFGVANSAWFAVFSPASPLQKLAFQIGGLQTAVFTLALLAFIILYYSTVARATQDLRELTSWARDSAENPKIEPPQGRYLELSTLSGAFASLVKRLKHTGDELKAQNERLEEQVKEKTQDIVANHELLQEILSDMPQAVILLDGDDTIAFCNRVTEKDFGTGIGERLPQGLYVALLSALERGRDYTMEVDGRKFVLSANRLEMGRTLALIRDETSKRAIEEQLLQAQKLEAVSRLAGGVAHEFNNALASIIPGVEMIRLQSNDEKTLRYLDRIESAAYGGADVVRQLLAFSRTGDEIRQVLDLNDVIEGAIKIFKPAAKSAEVLWNPGKNMPRIKGDEKQLQQLILNMAINSLDAIGSNGRITLESWCDESREWASFSIADNGPGIPPHIAKIIFDPFFTTKEAGKGTGLGLAIAFGVVERHGGKIRYKRSEDGGACFEVRLPAFEETPSNKQFSTSPEDVVIG